MAAAIMPSLIGPTADAQEGVERWRTTVDRETIRLFSAEYDSTDVYGRIAFSCRSGSGDIEVAVRLGQDDLKPFARVIADDLYPAISFPKIEARPSGLLIERMTFGELGGWEFFFQLDEQHRSMATFETTGSFHLAIGKVFKSGIDLKVGLDAITTFRRQCRKRGSSPGPTRKTP